MGIGGSFSSLRLRGLERYDDRLFTSTVGRAKRRELQLQAITLRSEAIPLLTEGMHLLTEAIPFDEATDS